MLRFFEPHYDDHPLVAATRLAAGVTLVFTSLIVPSVVCFSLAAALIPNALLAVAVGGMSSLFVTIFLMVVLGLFPY